MKRSIISLFISIESYNSVKNRIFKLALKKQSSYICVANVHMTIEAYWDSNFANIVNDADLVTPDGMPLVKALKLLYGVKQERVAGMDLLPDLLLEAEAQGLTVFFYGGTQEMLDQTKDYISTNFPRLKEHYYYSPPFRPISDDEEKEIVKSINDSNAHIVFVALGCPKQEKWMASMKGRVHACMIGIGGALPVMIGLQKRAPKWMQQASLEWLYRLSQEPKRLFKRYFITNSLFLILLFKQWLSLNLFKK